jgi:hypothetical protein
MALGRVALDLAVMLADGGEAIADLAVLHNQPDLFGEVASDPTAWRVLAALDEPALRRLRMARVEAREVAPGKSRDALEERVACSCAAVEDLLAEPLARCEAAFAQHR